MTSASELFHSRRSRIGRNDSESGFGSSSSFDRSLPFPVPGHNLHHHHNRRRSRRREIEELDSLRRPSSHSRHSCHREHESIRLDHGASQFIAGNSSNNGTSSSRANRMQYPRSDQLPGDVLLARERLVERLRGVSLTSNSARQSSRITSGALWDESTYNDDFSFVDSGNWDIEASSGWFGGDTPVTDSSTLTDTLSSLPHHSTRRPPGLHQEELNRLRKEVFTIEIDNNGLALEVMQECSICLDKFQEGDNLICLPCEHKFHSQCLCPWVQTCGDCPNCRASVIINNHKTDKGALSNPS